MVKGWLITVRPSRQSGLLPSDFFPESFLFGYWGPVEGQTGPARTNDRPPGQRVRVTEEPDRPLQQQQQADHSSGNLECASATVCLLNSTKFSLRSNMHLKFKPRDWPLPDDDESGPPSPTFDDLVEAADWQTHEVAAAWFEAHSDTEWATAIREIESNSAPTMEEPGPVKARMRILMDAIVPKPLLVIREGRAQVVHAFRRCPAMGEYRAMGLIGEREATPRGTLIPPKLVRPQGAIADQYLVFTRVEVPAPGVAEIETLLEEDPDLEMVPEAGPAQDGGAPVPMVAWKVLPLHPKIAAFFTRGMPVKEAFRMAVRLYHATPLASRDGLEGLLAFVACGITQSVTEDGDVRSALETSWVREDPASSDHLEGWYHDLLDAYLPPPAPKTPPRTSGPVPARVTPPGPEGQEGTGSPYGASTPAKKMPYTAAQRQDLATYCGLALSPDVVESADLPEFWQGFEDSRAKKTTARQAIEEHRRQNYPTGKLDRVTVHFRHAGDLPRRSGWPLLVGREGEGVQPVRPAPFER